MVGSRRHFKEQGLKRDRERPRKILTGLRGKPRKLFDYSESSEVEYVEVARLTEIPIYETVRRPEANEWYDAMASELNSIIKNCT